MTILVKSFDEFTGFVIKALKYAHYMTSASFSTNHENGYVGLHNLGILVTVTALFRYTN